jgi:hypothetical protein
MWGILTETSKAPSLVCVYRYVMLSSQGKMLRISKIFGLDTLTSQSGVTIMKQTFATNAAGTKRELS